MVTTAKLQVGDVVVKGGEYGDHTWPQTFGLEAPRVAWAMAVDDATAILAGPRETTITMTSPDGRVKKIERVYVVGEDHSPDALVRVVIFTDVRFLLSFGWVKAQYNVTVPSGTGRQTQADGIPTTTLPIVANVLYAPNALRGSDDGPIGQPWNATQIALDILKRTCEGHDFPPIQFRDLSRPRASFVPNDVAVDSDGKTALGQVLGALGGLDVRVADDGALELIDAYLGAEKKTVEDVIMRWFGADPRGSLERQGKLRWISMANVAPRSGLILLTRRCEVRGESLEVQPAARYSAVCDNTIWNTTNDPVLINVAKVTDLSLVVPSSVPANIGGGQTMVVGTLLAMDALIDAIAALNDQPATTPQLSRQFMLAGSSSTIASSLITSGRFGMLYVAADAPFSAGAGPNVLWIQRISSIVSSFRRLYLLNPVFARLCRKGSIKAERAGLLDAATQQRQPATAYCDYVQRPKNPGMSKQDKFGWQMNSIPPTSPNQQDYAPAGGIKSYSEASFFDAPFSLNAATPSPFDVHVPDPTRGVFVIQQARQDTSKLQHEAENLEGLVWTVPSRNYDPIQGDAIALWEQAKQLLTHRLSIVFSAVPGGTNNPNALHAYDVTVADALARLGAPPDAVSPRAPTRELRVREGVTEARIPWDDQKRADILACFAQTGTGDPTTLVPVNDAQLKDFAISVFANHLAALLDHYEGTMNLPFTPELMPLGSLRQVSHTITADGRAYTVARCDGAASPAPPENTMLQSSRNILFGGLG